MYKRILKYLIIAIIAGYALLAIAVIPSLQKSGNCKGMIISVLKDDMGIINEEDIYDIIYKEELDPTGKNLEDFKCCDIETFLNGISIIDECQVYKSVKGYVKIDVRSKTPVMTVQDKDNRTYHIDNKGNIIHGIQKALYLPVASGNIDDSIAVNELKDIADVICKDKFWNSQIEQLYFDKEGKITIVPRVGNHIIEFGTAKNVEKKFDKLYTFYREGMNNIGWNKYSKINVEYSDRVICTKRDKYGKN